jgi:hypothetical protein
MPKDAKHLLCLIENRRKADLSLSPDDSVSGFFSSLLDLNWDRDDRDPNVGQTLMVEFQLLCCTFGNVNDAPANARAPVVHPD